MSTDKVVLITGAAKRVGAVIARHLHAQGMRIALHYRSSRQEAQHLCDEFNQLRADSALLLQADLAHTDQLAELIPPIEKQWGQLDVLINNASSFYPTPVGTVTAEHWEDLFSSNLKAPFFLAQAAAPLLAQQRGCIINIVDIHARQPLKAYPVYCMAKAGLMMMTKVLAKELGPDIRVNGVAPGTVLAPDHQSDADKQMIAAISKQTALKRIGTPEDIAATVLFLINQAPYISGQIIAVDGGRLLS